MKLPEVSQSDPKVDETNWFELKSRGFLLKSRGFELKSSKHDAFTMFRRRSFDARRSRLAHNVKSAGCLLGGVVRQLVECV